MGFVAEADRCERGRDENRIDLRRSARDRNSCDDDRSCLPGEIKSERRDGIPGENLLEERQNRRGANIRMYLLGIYRVSLQLLFNGIRNNSQ